MPELNPSKKDRRQNTHDHGHGYSSILPEPSPVNSSSKYTGSLADSLFFLIKFPGLGPFQQHNQTFHDVRNPNHSRYPRSNKVTGPECEPPTMTTSNTAHRSKQAGRAASVVMFKISRTVVASTSGSAPDVDIPRSIPAIVTEQ